MKPQPMQASWWAQPSVQQSREQFAEAVRRRDIEAGWKVSGDYARVSQPPNGYPTGRKRGSMRPKAR